MKATDLNLVPNGTFIRLKYVEAGSFFEHDGKIYLKSHHGNAEAYALGSGERFWGGTFSTPACAEVYVLPLRLKNINEIKNIINKK